jgi:DNA (cytosine-5)-methyltransferase 1
VIETAVDRRGLIDRIDELLEARYRSGDLGNLDDPLAETVYILISQQTREAVYRRVYNDLRMAFPRWIDCARAPRRTLEKILAPAGFQRRRAHQLRELLRAVEADNRKRGIDPAPDSRRDLTLDYLRDMTDKEAETYLTSLPGIGPKSARCVLTYSLSRAAFPVDTHVHRIFRRLGLVESNGRKRDHDPFQDAVPDAVRKRLHINLVHHGRAICTTLKPKCGQCVLVSFCAEGRVVANTQAQKKPVAVELFAGAGGMGYGFQEAGFRIALAIEADRHAAQTYRLNNPGVPVVEARIDGSTRASRVRKYIADLDVDALLAGFPCQGYSAAGPRQPQDARNNLYRDVARLARQLKAQTLVAENVPGLRQVNGRGFLAEIVREFEDAGYSIAAHLLRACDFGVPQHRVRYFFLGTRSGTPPPEPSPTHRNGHGQERSHAGMKLPRTPTLESLLRKLPALPHGTLAETYWHDGYEFLNMSTMAHSPRVISKIKGIDEGEGPISYRRLERDEARTLIAGHRALPVHPWLHRTISVREAAVIQGFPMGYFFCGPRSEQPLQVANAVPPPLARAVAEHVRAAAKI